MSRLTLSPEELLSGANATYELMIPLHILRPGSEGSSHVDGKDQPMAVTLRPLTIGTFLLIMKAAKEDPGLIPLLMIKEALVEPQLSLPQVKQLHMGLVDFLIENIRQISGLSQKKSPIVS